MTSAESYDDDHDDAEIYYAPITTLPRALHSQQSLKAVPSEPHPKTSESLHHERPPIDTTLGSGTVADS